MKTILTLHLTLFIHFFANAAETDSLKQSYTTSIGKSFNATYSDNTWAFGTDSAIVRIQESSSVTISSFNASDLTHTKTIQARQDTIIHGFTHEAFYQQENHIMHFFSAYSSSTRQTELYCKKTTIDAEMPSTQTIHLTSIPKNISAIKDTKIEISASRDGSKLLLYYKLVKESSQNRRNHEGFGVHVFDKELHEIWNKKFRFEETESYYTPTDFIVTNSGNVFISLANKKPTTEPFQIAKINQTGIEYLQITLKESEYPSGIKLKEIAGEKLLCIGFIKFQRYLNELSITTISFNGELLKQSYKSIKGYNGYNFMIDNIIEENDSTFYILSEEFEKASFITEKTRPATIIGTILLCQLFPPVIAAVIAENIEVQYFMKDIAVAKITTNGSLEWMTRIDKNQQGHIGYNGLGTSNANFQKSRIKKMIQKDFSYNYLIEDGTIYLTYVDVLSNNTKEKKNITHHNKGNALAICKIDGKTGAYEKEHVLDFNNFNGATLSDYRNQNVICLDNKFLMEFSLNKSEKAFVSITIE